MTRKVCLSVLVMVVLAVPASSQPANQPAQNVNVVNTPTVHVATSTEKIFDQSYSATSLSDPIDVSAFREIRIVARCVGGACFGGSGQITVTAFLVYGSNTLFDVIQLGSPFTAGPVGDSALYEVPGQLIRIKVEPSFESSGRVVIYGRPN
jgi:hypothetical protein